MSDANTDAPKKKGKILKIILMILGFLLFLGGGFAGGIYYAGMQMSPSEEVLRLVERTNGEGGGSGGEDSGEGEGEDGEGGPQRMVKDIPETPVFQTSYYEFPDTLTTNLKGSRRFLQVGIGMSTQYDASVITNVETHAMAIRSDFLAVISGFSEEDVAGMEGRDRLAAAMKQAVNNRLEQLEGFGGIENVFFPSFVLQ
ncbi:flagellar basal body-associated protein FliL [Donghicola sp.]|jgi:flagellar FliL protein|uniref:flagellar basal body-associated FliL family protein n=1 Tax=Donghicola sp. TaxID=1929294 RepID=UPI0025EDEA7C|nr:flagellar basal body-associated FliL family protein [Donghicola sp.]MCT4579055.1 flagellar basal body-associated FliL family protein [Donghicola sp.]